MKLFVMVEVKMLNVECLQQFFDELFNGCCCCMYLHSIHVHSRL